MSYNYLSEGGKNTFGLLPHEARFLESILPKAQAQQLETQRAVGEANSNSGGDWAFDDPATQFAAQEALLKDSSYKELLSIYNHGKALPVENYPPASHPIACPGSRVAVRTNLDIDRLDLVTRRIPGMPEDEENDVSLISVSSALGKVLLGSAAGQILLWEVNGRRFRGELQEIDQCAQREFYTSIGLAG